MRTAVLAALCLLVCVGRGGAEPPVAPGAQPESADSGIAPARTSRADTTPVESMGDQATPPGARREAPVAGAEEASSAVPPPRLPREPGALLVRTPPPLVGACLGGSCGASAWQAPVPTSRDAAPTSRNRRARFAYTGAIVATASAGLLLGGALALLGTEDAATERVATGLWVGQLALATPLVALSGFLARRQTGFDGYRGLRRLGWTAYGAALGDGMILLHGALNQRELPALLTVSAGVLAAFALLPHALDAYTSARHARRRFALQPGARGLALRF